VDALVPPVDDLPPVALVEVLVLLVLDLAVVPPAAVEEPPVEPVVAWVVVPPVEVTPPTLEVPPLELALLDVVVPCPEPPVLELPAAAEQVGSPWLQGGVDALFAEQPANDNIVERHAVRLSTVDLVIGTPGRRRWGFRYSPTRRHIIPWDASVCTDVVPVLPGNSSVNTKIFYTHVVFCRKLHDFLRPWCGPRLFPVSEFRAIGGCWKRLEIVSTFRGT
jgi:hypothetical protein